MVDHCKSTRVRKKALREDTTLDELLKYARSLEISDRNAEQIEGRSEERQDKVYHVRSKNRTPGKHKACYRCVGTYPHQDQCPASNFQCRKCKKVGHFTNMCKSKAPKSSQRPRIPKRKMRHDNEESHVNTLEDTPSERPATATYSSSDKSDNGACVFTVSVQRNRSKYLL